MTPVPFTRCAVAEEAAEAGQFMVSVEVKKSVSSDTGYICSLLRQDELQICDDNICSLALCVGQWIMRL